MNRIKAFYISTYVGSLMIFSMIASLRLFELGWHWQWAGALLSTLPMTLFFIRLFVTSVARTSRNLPTALTLTLAGSAVTLWAATTATPDLLALTQSLIIGLIGLLLYIHWYSRFPERRTEQLTEGELLPVFQLEDTEGNLFSSDQLDGYPALLIFYRGNWCPLCMAQIKEVADQYKSLAEAGVKVVLISPQPQQHSRKLAERFEVPFLFLVDKDNQVARQLDLFSANGTPAGMNLLGYSDDTVMPTVLMTDRHRKIIFADLTDNYRVRPEPETFIKTLQAHSLI